MADVDTRLDELEHQVEDLTSELTALKRPWYRTGGFKTSAVGIALALLAWAYAFIGKEPEIPRMLHQHVLMSDQALALIMDRDISNAESDGALEKQMARKVKAQIEHDDTKGYVSTIADEVFRSTPSKQMLFEIAATKGARTYSDARIFRRQLLNLGSVRCQIISDPELWAFLNGPAGGGGAAPPPTHRVSARLKGACDNNEEIGAETEIAFLDTAPVVVPYIANPGDHVELRIQVLANSYDEDGDPLRSSVGHTYVEAFHERPNAAAANTPVAFNDVVQNNLLTASFTAPEGDLTHLIFVELNEAGAQKLDNEAQNTLIVVFATVTVIPASEF